MGTQYDSLSDQHIKFIGQQHLFFSGSAGPEGKVNCLTQGHGQPAGSGTEPHSVA